MSAATTSYWPGTPVAGGRLTAVTVETVRLFRPECIDLRLVRAPVAHVAERFGLGGHRWARARCTRGARHRLAAGWSLVGEKTAARWEATVAGSLASVKEEAERRGRR